MKKTIHLKLSIGFVLFQVLAVVAAIVAQRPELVFLPEVGLGLVVGGLVVANRNVLVQ